jgi:MOSC domain-containing protein YiiM
VKLVSINVGLPKNVDWYGRTVRTSIWKRPVAGRVPLTTLNLEGDRQSDLSVHGGPNKAVYVYPSEHYAYWREELPGADLPWGVFGENLTTEGLLETDVRIGDRLRMGSAELFVTQPRLPCYKLGIRFGDNGMIKRFQESGRSGFYVAVSRAGDVSSGDRVELLGRDEDGMTVDVITALYAGELNDHDLLRRASLLPALPEGWKDDFRQRLSDLIREGPSGV